MGDVWTKAGLCEARGDNTSQSSHSSKHTIVDRHYFGTLPSRNAQACSLIFHSTGGVKQIIEGKMFFLPFFFPAQALVALNAHFHCHAHMAGTRAMKINLSQSCFWPVNSQGKAYAFNVGAGLKGSCFGWQEATEKQDYHSPLITALLITEKLQVSSHHSEHTPMNVHRS